MLKCSTREIFENNNGSFTNRSKTKKNLEYQECRIFCIIGISSSFERMG